MYIEKITARNFRLLKESTLSFKDKLCLLIGRNNSGKTSFLVLFEKFYNSLSFDYNDFSTSLRSRIDQIQSASNTDDLSIQLIIKIVYEVTDDLNNLSEFIMDLDPKRNDVNILFECSINKDKLIKSLQDNPNVLPQKFIQKYLSQFLDKKIFIFDNDGDLEPQNKNRLIKIELDAVKKLIDFEIIHAKRSVSSSEEKTSHKVLSALTTKYYNGANTASPDNFSSINKIIENMDLTLNGEYNTFFNSFVCNARDFLNLDGLKVISNLKANEIVGNSSEVVYGDERSNLPEYLNGLGYMNILYLLLSIEIKKTKFLYDNKDIKLLFVEEPEAHTHPQLQCIFARKIAEILNGVCGLQTIITTHSPHIVSNHSFKNIRYMLRCKDASGSDNIEIKNFYEDLKVKYGKEISEFQFINQYLSIEAAELFFADKVIFIEGTSENMLMPYFISTFDRLKIEDEKEKIIKNPELKPKYVPISSQNISMLQVGSNAKAFRHFLEFLNLKTLIITDIDTTHKTSGSSAYSACAVDNKPENISNQTLKYYFGAPDLDKKAEFTTWLHSLISGGVCNISDAVKVSYQKSENGYHARSFEEAFINVNRADIEKNLGKLFGLKNISHFKKAISLYNLTDSVIDKKSDFAASLLFLTHTQNFKWAAPLYIQEGLEWIQKS